MHLNQELFETLQLVLSNYSGQSGELTIAGAVSGGSINKCYQLTFNRDSYFLKLNSAISFPGMFSAEAYAISRIKATDTIASPNVIANGEAGTEQYLLLDWIEKGANDQLAQEKLGRGLADLHRVSNKTYGLDHSNYMGSLTQINGEFSYFEDFFIGCRLKPQVDLAFSKGLLATTELSSFEKLYTRFADCVPVESPALVHGDLWSGNYMIAAKGTPYIIDPAIAFSHREVDLAMTKLFGGFDRVFYDAYLEAYPLVNGWQNRTSLWNLYPLLIHLNLFGRGYLNDVKQALKQWI